MGTSSPDRIGIGKGGTGALSSVVFPSPFSKDRDGGSCDSHYGEYGGWRAVLGATPASLRWFRRVLGALLVLELTLRYRFLRPFYSDDGTLPTDLLLHSVDLVYSGVCLLHCWLGALWQLQLLLTVQLILAVAFAAGYAPRWTALASWYLYLSLTLRNPWLNYILDRYFHYLLFLSVFMPLDRPPSRNSSHNPAKAQVVVSPAILALKGLVLWIYLDAGYGKYSDPLGGWSYKANPLPALDTYARHTLPAQYLYALLHPTGLRLLTPSVVYVELGAAPLAILGGYLGSVALVRTAVAFIVALHLGIALTLRNSALLSLVACTAWIPFLPLGFRRSSIPETKTPRANIAPRLTVWESTVAAMALGFLLAGNLWFETTGCDQARTVQTIWSTLLHNRWNVFIGAEEYVTWEIAPGLLADGSVVDVWGRRNAVDWSLPGTGAPSTATARPGRWRSFPYLAELTGRNADALWGYLCREWNLEHPDQPQLVRYNFFMLQADVLPNMTFGPTRKRLIHAHECEPPVVAVSAVSSLEYQGDVDAENRGQGDHPHEEEL